MGAGSKEASSALKKGTLRTREFTVIKSKGKRTTMLPIRCCMYEVRTSLLSFFLCDLLPRNEIILHNRVLSIP